MGRKSRRKREMKEGGPAPAAVDVLRTPPPADGPDRALEARKWLAHAGVPAASGWDRFWRAVHRHHGQAGADFQELVQAREVGDSSGDLYEVVNSTLDLALLAAGQYQRPVWEPYLNWWLGEALAPPSRLLDVGCGVGVVTAFYARLYPDCEVIGIDPSPASVARATELATRMGLANLRFETARLDEAAERFGAGTFGCVTSLTSLLEIAGRPRFEAPADFSPLQMPPCSPDPRFDAATQAVAELLTDDGLFVSLERLRYDVAGAAAVDSFRRAGLTWQPQRSYFIHARHPGGREERLPLLVARKAQHVEDHAIDDIIGFFAYEDLQSKFEHLQFEGSAATLLFRALSPTELLYGLECVDNDGAGTERTEIWRAGGLVAMRRHTTERADRLALHSASVADELAAKYLGDAALGRASHCQLRVWDGDHYRPTSLAELMPRLGYSAQPLGG